MDLHRTVDARVRNYVSSTCVALEFVNLFNDLFESYKDFVHVCKWSCSNFTVLELKKVVKIFIEGSWKSFKMFILLQYGLLWAFTKLRATSDIILHKKLQCYLYSD